MAILEVVKIGFFASKVITQSSEGSASTEAVRAMVQVCLRNAAVINYERISDFAQHDGECLQAILIILNDIIFTRFLVHFSQG